MTDHSRPLAIGILGLPDKASDFQQRQARIGIALTANAEGYALLEIFQLMGTTRGDEPVYNAVEVLATRMEVAAVILSGIVDHGRVAEMAERVRLTVVKIPGSNFTVSRGARRASCYRLPIQAWPILDDWPCASA